MEGSHQFIGTIHAGIVGGQIVNLGVWRSTNNGDNRNQVIDGIFYPFIDALCFDSAGYAYAGSLGGGLYKSTFVISVKNEQKNIPKSFTLYELSKSIQSDNKNKIFHS